VNWRRRPPGHGFREDRMHMQWKVEQIRSGALFGASAAEDSWARECDERYPTVGEVVGEMAATVSCCLAFALAVDLLLLVCGL
jgi:hypothetical protein